MSNETDLDWLARNVHVWDESAYAAMCGGVERVIWISGQAYGQDPEFKNAVPRDQWLARRAELQNKPSWEDAPEWALELAQDSNGRWFFYADTPTAGQASWCVEGAGDNELSGRGEVLGDWRDTLEQRPDIHKSEPKTDTSAERIQKTAEPMRVSARGNDWFERGELPPVGAKVQWRPGSIGQWEHDSWIDVDVIAHAGDGDIVIKWDGQAGNNKQLVTASQETFRPVRTERDVAIEEMCQVAGLDGLMFGLVAGKLYDAGYRKESK